MPTPAESISTHFRKFQDFLSGYLSECLPQICSGNTDWWQIMVRGARLKGAQKNRIRSGSIRKLEDLDPASLCSLLSCHWQAIARHGGIEDPQNEAQVLCDWIINLRNRMCHEGSGNRLGSEEELHALMVLSKLSVLLGAPRELISVFEQDKSRVLSALTSSPPSNLQVQFPASPQDHEDGAMAPPLPSLEDQGIPLEILSGSGEQGGELQAALSMTTYVGIDFGTSTTVVSRVCLDPSSKVLRTEPIPIPQIDRMGRTHEDYLVPSCISYHNDLVLVGRGAAELKAEQTLGVDTWFSFKMELGVDQGPIYPRSKLDGEEGRVEVRRPQDAAVVFFRYLREHIEAWVRAQRLPEEIRYAVSVPASFEANQRQDLCRVMQTAGINIEGNAIIDEPNAAFISYLLHTLQVGDGIVNAFRGRTVNALVFDFGAGTCDISVLEVTGKEDRLVSRNLAISQFRALGGDNIDRQIARKILWPAIEKKCLKKGQRLRQAQLDQLVLPRLQPVAERLKVQCCKWIEARAQGGDLSSYRDSDMEISEAAIEPMLMGEIHLQLDRPCIRLREFFEIMEPFLAKTDVKSQDPELISVLEPIDSALGKARLSKEELNMVVFIGGSAQNPLVKECVRSHMGRFVECVMGQDVRTPVSRGAALHSLVWNGLDFQFIRPITSETIYILTVGEKLHPLIQAGSPIPSPEAVFTDQLIVANRNQRKVDLPLCVSTSSKILYTLELRPPDGGTFEAGDRITVSAHLDENKLLHVQAKLGQSIARGELINPLANAALTAKEMERLKARQKLNESMLKGVGKPDLGALERFAHACAESGAHLEAAETYEALFRLNPSSSNASMATKICYHYDRCEKDELSGEWAEQAYRIEPTWVTAFNLSLNRKSAGDTRGAMDLLREANRLGPNQPTVLAEYGASLIRDGDPREGQSMLKQALEIYQIWMETGEMGREDTKQARRLGQKLDNKGFLLELTRYERNLSAEDAAYDEGNLAASIKNQKTES